MTIALNKAAPTMTVTVMLEALQQVLDFETYISKKYAMPVRHYMFSLPAVCLSIIFYQLLDILKLTLGSTVRRPKSIATAFEPHMGVFIEAQNK